MNTPIALLEDGSAQIENKKKRIIIWRIQVWLPQEAVSYTTLVQLHAKIAANLLTSWQSRLNIRQKQQYSRLFVQKRKSLFGHLEPLREPPLEPLYGLLGGEAELKARARSGVDVQVHRGRARLRVHSRACEACRTESGQSVSLSFFFFHRMKTLRFLIFV